MPIGDYTSVQNRMPKLKFQSPSIVFISLVPMDDYIGYNFVQYFD